MFEPYKNQMIIEKTRAQVIALFGDLADFGFSDPVCKCPARHESQNRMRKPVYRIRQSCPVHGGTL